MNLYVLNKARDIIAIEDTYESLIWNPQFYEPGEFEIYTRANSRLSEIFALDNYVLREGSDMVGVIERVQIVSDLEDGDHMIISGRDAKSFLARRIIWKQRDISGTIENVMRTLITENAISPTLSYRKIPDLLLGDANGWTEKIDTQYTGDNLLEAVVALCKLYGYGFKVVLNAQKKFVIQFYRGIDRSYSQTTNSFVVFSPEFENITTSDFTHDKSTLKNACNVAGEGEGNARKYYGVGTVSGLERREMFVDARDLSSEVEDESGNKKTLTTAEYNDLLVSRGREQLAENPETFQFEGEAETTRQYVYGEDFDLGDVVQVKDNYGTESPSRIIGVIDSDDENGRKIIPTFASWEVDNE